MGIEIKKQGRETSQNLIRRFTRGIQQSGILFRARKIRFKKREKSEQMKKRAALRKEEKRREYESLKKLGKIK